MTDNLGTYRFSYATGVFPTDAGIAASLLAIVSPEIVADRRYGIPRDLSTIPNETSAFREFVEGRATSVSVTSLLFAPKLDVHNGMWSSTFNLVIGDSFSDRILFWNARLHIPAWLDRDLCCLRIGLEQLTNPEFLNIIGDLLKRRNHVNGGSGGQSQVAIRSTSLSQGQLEDARRLIESTKPWGMLYDPVVCRVEDAAPPPDVLAHAREGNRFGDGIFLRPDWTRFDWSSPVARPPAISPDHLADAPSRQVFTEGHWTTDFAFQLEGPRPRFFGEGRWMLPRRWRMAGAFSIKKAGEQHDALPPPARRSRDGNLAVFIRADYPIETITIPTSFDAIRYALVTDGNLARLDAENDRVIPPSKAIWIAPSNEARYLTGVLGMAGSLQSARQALLHPFLRMQFANLGGTPALDQSYVTPTANRLRKMGHRQPAFDLKSDRDRTVIAELIVKSARGLKRPLGFVGYDRLKASWKEYREEFWRINGKPIRQPQDDFDWDHDEEVSLDRCLIELRRRQILFQGHQWTCQKCHHRNWVDFAALASELACEVCKQVIQAPVDIRWLFRPNDFLIESLRDHSVLSLVWTMSALCDRSRRSISFVEPTWFGFSSDSVNPDAEADLLVLIDGEAMLCEVKSSWHALRSADMDDFVSLATRLRPDIALLSVMEEGRGPVGELARVQAALNAENIKFEVFTPTAHALDDGPYLDIVAEE